MHTRLTWLAVTMTLLTGNTASSETIHIPGDFSTIQAGILASTDGDTVLVADGLYSGNGNRDIDFGGKAIVVKSERGPGFTIINCEGDSLDFHRGFLFQSMEDSSSILDGFTIMNGWYGNGGGIACENSSPTISNNIITKNTAAGFTYGYGGGIYFYYSSSIITGTIIADNTAKGNGGGIYGWESPLTIDGCTILNNVTSFYGGGIYLIYGGLSTVTSSILRDNTADSGPQIYSDSGALLTIMYSDVEGDWPGPGNLDDDPLFVLPARMDYRLLWGSPCIDTGNPGSFDPDGTVRDIGACSFDQTDDLTLYMTPDRRSVTRGGQLGITYTVINRWEQSTPFWILTKVKNSNGLNITILGPAEYTLPAGYTAQVHLVHDIPVVTPPSIYEYRGWIGVPPGTLYDMDLFSFEVTG